MTKVGAISPGATARSKIRSILLPREGGSAPSPPRSVASAHNASSEAAKTSIPVASVRLLKDDQKFEAIASGDGQVDALCKAIKKAAGFEGKLASYHVGAITGGMDSLGDVTIKLQENGWQVTGRAVGSDVVEASGRAFLNAINRMRVGTRDKPKPEQVK